MCDHITNTANDKFNNCLRRITISDYAGVWVYFCPLRLRNGSFHFAHFCRITPKNTPIHLHFSLYRNLRSYTVKNLIILPCKIFEKLCFSKCTWLKKSDNAPHFRSQSGAAKPLFLLYRKLLLLSCIYSYASDLLRHLIRMVNYCLDEMI